jgi:hypothetical protein
VGVLRLQEDDGKLHSDVLIFPPASIVGSDGELVVHIGGWGLVLTGLVEDSKFYNFYLETKL